MAFLSWIRRSLLQNEGLVFGCIVAFFLRIPNLFEPYWYGDEGIYLTVGNGLRHGLQLYQGIVDHKTPLMYVFAMVPSLFWFKVILLVISILSLCLFYGIAKKLLPSQKASVVATWCFMLVTTLPAFEGNIVNAELFVAFFSLLSVSVLLLPFKRLGEASRPKNFSVWTSVVAGIFMGLSILTKVPAVFDAIAFAIFILLFWRAQDKFILHKLKYLIAYGVGLLIPIALCVLYFWITQHSLQSFIYFAYTYNLGYAHHDLPTSIVGISPQLSSIILAVLSFLMSGVGRLALLAASIFGTFRFLRKIASHSSFWLSIWFSCGMSAVLLSLRAYPHYWLHAAIPIALLLGYLAEKKMFVEKNIALSSVLLGILSLIALRVSLYPTLPYYVRFIRFVSGNMSQQQYMQEFDSIVPDTYSISKYVINNTSPEEKIYVWGTNSLVYALSRRLPVGKYTVSYHTSDFANAYPDTTAALIADKPKLIVVYKNEFRPFDYLYALIAEEYMLVKEYDSALVYQRVPANHESN